MSSVKEKLSEIDIKELIKTPRGKGITAGLVLIVVLLIVLAIVTVALPKPASQAVKAVNNPVMPASSAPQAPAVNPNTAAATDDATNTVITEYSLFEYKDPFKPLSEASTDTATAGNNSTGGSSINDVDVRQSLALLEIVEQDGTRYAIVRYEGQEYTVAEGEQIADSSFKVMDIGDGSVSLLYGDDRLTLQLGDEIVK